MRRYAEDTKVPVSRSRGELEHILERFGADQFAYGRDGRHHVVGFRIEGRYVRIDLPVPPDASDQEERRLWRSLAMIVKAKLEAVHSNISTVEREFLADIVLPDGQRVGQWLRPQIEHAYEHGEMPALLPYHG